MNQLVTPKFGIGAPIKRKEDAPLIQGQGIYTDDYRPEGCLFGFMLRSPMPHARITIASKEEALALPGVAAVLTADDIEELNPMPTKAVPPQADGSSYPLPAQPVLCKDTVRYVGDAIAFVVADSVNNARAAAELIEVDYDPLDVTVDTAGSLEPSAPKVWPEFDSNLAFTLGQGDAAKADAAFEGAHRVTKIELINNRVVGNYMETRGCIGEYDPETGRYTLTAGTQGGHGMRDIVAGDVMGIETDKLRVVTPEVGGGFGTKAFAYREYPLCLLAAKRLGKPVKWTADRMDHFVSDAHGRDNVTTAELALDENGKMLGLKVEVIADMGAYLHQYGPFIPFLGISMSSGLYDIPAVWATVKGVYSNRVPTDAFRGAGRPEAAYLLERLVEKAGIETGLGSAEIRRRNFIASEALPYTTQTGRMYDTGDFAGHMDKAMVEADWDGFAARQAESASNGKYRGIGMCTYIEACAFAGSEEATVELNENGSVTLLIGTQTNGQGHATAYGQVIAEHLGLTLDEVEMIQGDTDRVRKGGGTGGSRSIPLGMTSVEGASKSLVKQIKELAADKLEAGIEDLELVSGNVRVVGTDQQVTLAEIAAAAPAKLTGQDEVKQDECTYPNGTHISEVEVDPETGDIDILNYVIVDDFGVTVNPILLAGQVHGGIVNAISQALYEHTVYDEDGQLLTASLLDYRLARAADIPEFNFQTRNIPSTTNALGIKGAGEAGTIGGCAAIMNAVQKALTDGAGAGHLDMPATPLRVWEAIQNASA